MVYDFYITKAIASRFLDLDTIFFTLKVTPDRFKLPVSLREVGLRERRVSFLLAIATWWEYGRVHARDVEPIILNKGA